MRLLKALKPIASLLKDWSASEVSKKYANSTVIDIGCGYGNFLGFCHKNGYEATGVEPGRQAVEYIKNKFNLSVYQTNIEDFVKMTKEKYHVAVLLDVLEHMREPYKILTDVRDNILEDEGILVVRTPNEFNKLQLIANQEYRLKNWWISAPQHINYFTIAHLEKLITNCGYEVFLKEAAFPLEMFILFGDQYVGNLQLGRTIHKKRVLFEKTLKKYDNNYKRKLFQNFAEMGIGREITIYARKK